MNEFHVKRDRRVTERVAAARTTEDGSGSAAVCETPAAATSFRVLRLGLATTAVRFGGGLAALFLLGSSNGVFGAATRSKSMPVVPKWERFEHEFKSLAAYPNPLQDVTLTVQFTSPLGETSRVYGFWDGGRTWRVRFSPDQPGRWIFKSSCSDAANMGLNDQSGEFLCTASLNQNRFYQHGAVQVAQDRQHLEHADGTPFFWLADSVWSGARLSDPKNWVVYGLVRSSQNFTVAQWTAASGEDLAGQSALSGFPERLGVNPEFFRRLDGKVATLGEVGMLSAIAPLWETQSEAKAVALPDEQAALVVRYVVARWGADPVAWLIRLEGGPKNVERWKKIGAEVFAGMRHAPVVICAGKDPRVLNEFRDQGWVDVLGFQMPPSGAQGGIQVVPNGEIFDGGHEKVRHPLIAFTPEENAVDTQSGKRVSAEEVRRAAYRGLLLAHAAGISYAGQGVANWDTTVEPKTADKLGAGLPLWHKAMFMPAAKQMGHLAKLVDGVCFWQLRPEPKVLAGQTGAASASGQVFAASTPAKDLALVYVGEDRMLDLSLDEMPHAPAVTWFNPRQGENSPAVAVVVQRTCQFPTPSQGDWLLMLKAGK